MPFPNQLVECLATLLDLPVTTVSQHDRMLAVAGLRTMGGRGRSAAQVNELDAANLLIAVVGSPVAGPAVKETVQTFERYASLVGKQPGSFAASTWSSEVKILRELGVGHTFRDAIASLIRVWATSKPRSPNVFRDIERDPLQTTGDVELMIKFHAPRPEASIRIAAGIMRMLPDGVDAAPESVFEETVSAKLTYQSRTRGTNDSRIIAEMKAMQRRYPGDLHQIRVISDATISGLAALFSSSHPPP